MSKTEVGGTRGRVACASRAGAAVRGWIRQLLGGCSVAAPLAAMLSAALAPALQAQTYVPGQAYFGRSNYIEYLAGDMPVIFSAPHGGALTPAEIPDRVDDGSDPNFTTVTDSYTEQTAFAVQAAFASYFGHLPHVIVCQLKRTKIDCNRSLSEGVYETNTYATIAWNEFQDDINSASNAAVAQNGLGFYIDLHGQGHPIQRLELGYLLTAEQLTESDSVLNESTYPPQSSIRTLAAIVQQKFGMPFSQILRGSNSFGGLMVAQGYPSVPDPNMESPGDGTNPVVYPGDENPYFDGGYNTSVHGSQSGGGPVDSLQIEANLTGVRDTALNRTNYGLAIAQTLDYFFTNYYGQDLRLCAPCVWNGGAGQWASAANWADGVLPVSGNYLSFAGSGGAVSNNLPALTTGGGTVYSLLFATNVSGNYNVWGNPLSLRAGITNFCVYLQTVSNALTLLAPQTFTAAHGRLAISGPVTNGGFSLTFNANSNMLLNAAISGAGGLVKTGGGILSVNSGDAFQGPTTVEVGELQANNSTGSATGSGALSVETGAMLAGTGTVGGPVSVLGTLAPGNGSGILTITNGLTINGGATFAWTLFANSTNSPGVNFNQLAVSGGSVSVGGATLSLNFAAPATAPATNVAFWQSPHSWEVIALKGSAANPGAAGFGVISSNSFTAGKFVSQADGQGNVWVEFLPTPAPVVAPSLPGAGATNVTVSWSAVNNVTYQLQYTTNLAPANWLPLGNVTATGTNASLVDPGPVAPQRFYRVVIP